MSSRLRAVGGVLLSGLEATLSLLVLTSVVMLEELRAAYASGTASGTAEGTFVVGFLGLWLLSGFCLLAVVVTHGLVEVIGRGRRDGVSGLAHPLRRPAFELLAAGAVVLAVGFDPSPASWYRAALAASAVVALAVLLHVALDAVGSVRGVIADV